MKRIIIMAENRVGVIADIGKVLANNKINIETLDVESTGDNGIVILSTDNPDGALHALTYAGFKAVSDEALILKLKDEPGALAKIAEQFKQSNLDIRSFHILDRQAGYSMVALTTDDRAKAQALIDDKYII